MLFIDGENFLHKIEEIIKKEKIKEKDIDLSQIKLRELIENNFKNLKISNKFFYTARLHEHKETLKKSRELISFQRRLKANLEKQGFTFVISGNVRAQKVIIDGKSKIIFREKGVDVKIAVDLMSLSCSKKIQTVILCSSDSDLQPVVAELRRRGEKVIYLGFKVAPNKGLIYTTNESVLLKNREVIKMCLEQ